MDIEEPVLQAHTVVSFRAFEMQHKSKLKSMYPFLSADQINGKLKKQWEKLEEKDRQCFTKKCFKVTPVKESGLKVSKRNENKKNRENVSSFRKRQKDSLDVCDTPEYVNTEKLNDFRKQHKESYNNDFFLSRGGAHDAADVFGSSCSGHEKGRHRDSQGLDGSLYKQQGILKSSDSGRKEHARGRVSFNSTVSQDDVVDDDQGSNYSFRSDGDDDNDDPPGGFSDDEDAGVLLRRGDSQSDYNAYTMAHPINSSDDDDDDANLLIRREIDDYHDDVAIDENSQNQEKVDANKQLTKNTNKRTRRSADLGQAKKVKTAQGDQASITDADADLDMYMDSCKVAESSPDDMHVLFKSPLQAESKTRRKSKNSQKGKKAAPPVSETPLIGSSTTNSAGKETPAIQSNPDEADIITPQMDGVMQHLINIEKAKAPLKRKSDQSNTGEAENIQDTVPSKRVTRSLMSQSHKKMEGKENTTNIKQTRSTSNANKRNISERKSTRKPMNGKSDQSEKHADTLAPIDASGDAGRSTSNEITDDFGYSFMEGVADPDKDSDHLHNNTEQEDDELDTAEDNSFRINLRDDAMGDFAHQYHSSKMARITDSDSWSSSQASASSSVDTQPGSISNRRNQVNPALLKALRSIQMSAGTDDHSQQWSSSDEGELLSPALSGVTELSSSESYTEDGDKGVQESTRGAAAPSVQSQMEDGLCGMFGELTPPDRKTKGQYKTQRLLASGNEDRTRSFKQLFQYEDEFFS